MSRRLSLVARALVGCVRIYQRALSPLLGRRCRFYPTCSAYVIEAIVKRGAVVGVLMGCQRILRCNPLCAGGYDPVDGPDEDVGGEDVVGEDTGPTQNAHGEDQREGGQETPRPRW